MADARGVQLVEDAPHLRVVGLGPLAHLLAPPLRQDVVVTGAKPSRRPIETLQLLQDARLALEKRVEGLERRLERQRRRARARRRVDFEAAVDADP